MAALETINNIDNVRAVLLDIDGTLVHCNKALDGASELVAHLRNQNIQVRFVTNLTGRTGEEIAAFLEEVGIEANASDVHTSVDASLRYIDENYSGKAGFLVLPEPLKTRFNHIETSEISPDFVLIGDIYNAFSNKLLDRIFMYLQEGASLITFHRNIFYFEDGKKHLDSGAYTRLLEDATGLEAFVTGKPSPIFFEQVMKSLDLSKNQILVIGDDIETDILGAQNSGLESILIDSGKFESIQLHSSNPKPSLFVKNLRELIDVF